MPLSGHCHHYDRHPAPSRLVRAGQHLRGGRPSPQNYHLYRPAGEPDVVLIGMAWGPALWDMLNSAWNGRRWRFRPGHRPLPTGVQLPPAAALRRSHTRGRRPPRFPRDSRVSWHTVSLRSAASRAIIRTSEHFHVFPPPARFSVRMFGSGGKKRANASSNCAAL